MKQVGVIIFIGVNIFLCTSVHAQKTEEFINPSKTIFTFDSRDRDLVGSSYIHKEFLPAKRRDDETIYFIRYDAYQDEMEVQKDGEAFYMNKLFDYPVTFINDRKVYEVFKYKVKDTNHIGFFVVLFKTEDFSLLLKEKIKFHDPVEPKTGYQKYKPPTLKRTKDKLFIGYSKDHMAVEVPSKKKDFIKLFSDKSEEIEEFIKKNKLSIKKQNDLIKILKYYDSLK